MGRRGRIPTSMNEKAVRRRELRAARRPPMVAPQALTIWETRARSLEQLAMVLLTDAMRAPTEETAAKGQVMNPRFKSGLLLLDAADRLWDRVARVSSPAAGGPGPHAVPASPRSLTEYRRQRPFGPIREHHDDSL